MPFPNHHIARNHFWYARIPIAAFFIVTFGSLVVDPRFMFDALFLSMAVYSLFGWASLTSEERNQYRRAVAAANRR